MVILAGVFRFQTQDGNVYEPILTPIKNDLKFFITVCLRRAGEIFPDMTAVDENNDDKFGQLMRNKSMIFMSLITVNQDGLQHS